MNDSWVYLCKKDAAKTGCDLLPNQVCGILLKAVSPYWTARLEPWEETFFTQVALQL